MSASNKKKLRREQEAAKLTEKQKAEKKESKKLTIYTIALCAVIVLMVIAFVFILINNSGFIARHTTALTVDNSKVSTVELNYAYVDTISQFLNEYGSYASLFGLNTGESLSSQVFDEESGETWADYFLEQAESSLRSTYALYNDAVANGYTLTEEEQASMESNLSTMSLYATYYGYDDVDAYLQATYGSGSNEKSFARYLEVQTTAASYYTAHQNSLTYTDTDLRAKEAENYNAYSSYSYNLYTLYCTSFREGGTTDEEGNVTYSDEENAAAVVAAEEAAKTLTASTITTVEELDEAIAALPINAESTTAASTAFTDTLYSKVSSSISEWVTDGSRKAGDRTYIPNTSTDADGNETVNSYNVVFFTGSNDNTFPLVNVRHILVPFEGGTTDSSGNVTYSDEEKAATLEKAQALLDEWANGEATEDSFAAMANEKSTDSGSNTNGGLYEDVYPGQMVANFNDWCFEDGRKAGDTGIVESSYGYHIIYFVGNSTTNYRDYMITSDLRTADMSAWNNGLVEAAVLTVKNTSKVNRDLVLSSTS